MKKIIYILIILAVTALLVIYLYRDTIIENFFKPTESALEEGIVNVELSKPQVIAEGLDIPWEIVFLPGGDILLTERPGRLVRIGEDRKIIPISGVAHRGEGGLLGLALHPNINKNGWLYLYFTTNKDGVITNQVERYVLNGDALSERKIIMEGIPGATNHDGGRIAFGPDGFLYIATGDAGRGSLAQDKNSLAGKILRVNEDGEIPADNPFGNAIYSYGHRNVQGIAWDGNGQLWATEHGRSGVFSGYDELNKIIKGGNYGWPNFQGDASGDGTIPPQIHSGSSETWAPAGLLYLNNHLLFTGLRGEAIYVAEISTGNAENLKTFFRGEYGRLRSIVGGLNGEIYVLTNNRDGRGSPTPLDDRIIKIDPRTFDF